MFEFEQGMVAPLSSAFGVWPQPISDWYLKLEEIIEKLNVLMYEIKVIGGGGVIDLEEIKAEIAKINKNIEDIVSTMSSMNDELLRYEGFNDNRIKDIDTRLSNLSSLLNEHIVDYDKLKVQVDALKSLTSTIDSEIETIKGDITTINAKDESQDSEIASIKNDLSNVTDVSSEIETIKGDITTINAKDANQDMQINNINTILDRIPGSSINDTYIRPLSGNVYGSSLRVYSDIFDGEIYSIFCRINISSSDDKNTILQSDGFNFIVKADKDKNDIHSNNTLLSSVLPIRFKIGMEYEYLLSYFYVTAYSNSGSRNFWVIDCAPIFEYCKVHADKISELYPNGLSISITDTTVIKMESQYNYKIPSSKVPSLETSLGTVGQLKLIRELVTVSLPVSDGTKNTVVSISQGINYLVNRKSENTLNILYYPNSTSSAMGKIGNEVLQNDIQISVKILVVIGKLSGNNLPDLSISMSILGNDEWMIDKENISVERRMLSI